MKTEDSMKRTRDAVTRQLGLALEGLQHHPLTEETHAALIQALSELLLEAHGNERSNAHRLQGGEDEPEADV
jgi:hypothetical protein